MKSSIQQKPMDIFKSGTESMSRTEAILKKLAGQLEAGEKAGNRTSHGVSVRKN